MLTLLAAILMDTSSDRRITIQLYEVTDICFEYLDEFPSGGAPSIAPDAPPGRMQWSEDNLPSIVAHRVPVWSVQVQNGLLVVRATPKRQRRVAALLTELRFRRTGSLGP